MEKCVIQKKLTKSDVKGKFLRLRDNDAAIISGKYGKTFVMRSFSNPCIYNGNMDDYSRLKVRNLFEENNLSEGDTVSIYYNDDKVLVIHIDSNNPESQVKLPPMSCEIENYSDKDDPCKALLIHRDFFSKFEKRLITGKGACVYLLVDSIKNPKTVYVGYTGNPAERISTHKSEQNGKKFWKEALIFLFDDGKNHFDIADCAYLESVIFKGIKNKNNKKKALIPYVKPSAEQLLVDTVIPLIEDVLKCKCPNILKRSDDITFTFRHKI